jgi:threonine synthase
MNKLEKQKKGDFYHLECFDCKRITKESESVASCIKCGGPLIAKYDFDLIRSRINTYQLEHAPLSALKYLNFYPIRDFEKVVSLREGGTPLIHAKNLGRKFKLDRVYIKNEGANPTGCFKDRGTLVEITKAIELGAKAICLASTGNMAASCAAYSSIAGIPCYVLVPEGTPVGKLAQSMSYHARIIQVRGTYTDCAVLAEKMAKKHGFYLAGDYVFRREGQKSQGYEIVEQLRWRVPDYIVVPIGCGTNSSAIWQGFKDYYEVGLIDRLPKLIAVQAEGCSTVIRAANKKKLEYDIVKKPQTVCSAVAASNPLDGHIILNAIKESKGFGVEISDNEALKAQQSMAKNEGVFAEPSGALPVAAIKKLQEEGRFNKEDTIVAVITGNGLKDPVSATRILPDPPSIEPDISEIDHYLKYRIYQIRGAQVESAKEAIFTKRPTETQVEKVIREEFDLKLNKKVIHQITGEVRTFMEKGREVTHADFQSIMEETLNALTAKDKVLVIEDFELTTHKSKPAVAHVKASYKNHQLESNAFGVGPFDAIMKAMQDLIESQKGIKVTLQDYKVEIAQGGTDAVVKVTIVFTDKNNNKVIANATSPDIIEASVNAFEKAYNLLWHKNERKN